MSTLLLAVAAVALFAVGAALIWAVAATRRRAVRARHTAELWAHFVDTCPSMPTGTDGEAFALTSPGPAGDVSVQPDGLCLRLDRYAGRTFWLTWSSIRGLDPDPDGGAMLRLARGVEVHLPALACRAIWDAKARVGRPQAPAATAS